MVAVRVRRSMACIKLSAITLPTMKIRDGSAPSASRLATASSVVANSHVARPSVTTRLTSSGIVRSNERSPASTCATGTPSLAATTLHAMVEFTSPTTTTASTGVACQPGLERSHDASGLHGMGSTAHAEVDVGLGKAEHFEEAARHRGVVVLAGVHEERLDAARGAGAKDRRHLHEVGTRTSDDGNALHRDLQSSLTVSHMKAVLPTR